MFYTIVDGTYVPTTLGNALLIVLLAVLLAGAIVFARRYAAGQNPQPEETAKRNGRLTVKQLAFCAMSLAFALPGAAPPHCFPCSSSVSRAIFSDWAQD